MITHETPVARGGIMNATHSSSLPSAALQNDIFEGNVTQPNSQQSSFTETSASQHSQTRGPSTANFQRFNLSTHNFETPLTSLSNDSSQENITIGVRGRASESNATKDEGSITGRVAYKDASHTEQTGGHKRTATGQIKSPSSESLPQSPVTSSANGHSRKTSMVSGNSRIAEMSDKLQARMSYAKIKIEHGWEGHSIGDLERMTSTQASPVSASSYTARHTPPSNYSPVEYSPMSRRPRDASTSVPLGYHYSSPQNHTKFNTSENILNGLAAPETAAMLISKPNETYEQTYEQFWQSHSKPTLPSTRKSEAQSLNGRCLAPPVDFSSREAASNKQKQPSSDSNLFPGRLPSTPPTRNSAPPKLRTPSQQAAVEKDALEGLLSMNSPANSQNHPTMRPLLRSPLHGKAREPSLLLSGIVDGTSISPIDPARNANTQRILNDDEFNKILDDMTDSSSSDEDGVVNQRFPARKLLRS